MIEDIDIKKSIGINKLYFNRSKSARLIRMYYILFVCLGLPIGALFYAINNPDLWREDLIGYILLNVFIVSIPPMFIIALSLPVEMTRIKTKNNANFNFKIICSCIDELGWDLHYSSQEYIISLPNSYRKQITVLFDNNDILVSSVKFSKRDLYESLDQENLDRLTQKINNKLSNN